MLIQNYKVYNLYKNLVVVKKFSNDHCIMHNDVRMVSEKITREDHARKKANHVCWNR